MPTQTQIQNTILQAQQQAAGIILANTVSEQGGATNVNWWPSTLWYFNITALTKQYNLGDYTSNQCIAVYDCLNVMLGLDTSVVSIDPNYQPPSGTIIITNPNSYLSPVVLSFNDFDPTSQLGDGGRTRYINPNWEGVNPFMALTSPGLTGLEYGIDYTLIPSGGFNLLSTGNLPEIYSGQSITVYSYAIA